MMPNYMLHVEQLSWLNFYNSFGFGLEFELKNASGETAEVEYDDEMSDLLWDKLDLLDEDHTFSVYLDDDKHDDATRELLCSLDECGFDYERSQQIVKQLNDHGIEPAKRGSVRLVATNNPKTVGTLYYADNSVQLDATIHASGGGNNPEITAHGISTGDKPLAPTDVARKLGGDHAVIAQPINWEKTLKIQETFEDYELYECGAIPEPEDAFYDY